MTDLTPEDNFARRLREVRLMSEMTQADVAKAMQARGMTTYSSTINKIENRERSLRLDEAIALSDILKTPLTAMIGDTESTARAFETSLLALVADWDRASNALAQGFTNAVEAMSDISDATAPSRRKSVKSGYQKLKAAIGVQGKRCQMSAMEQAEEYKGFSMYRDYE